MMIQMIQCSTRKGIYLFCIVLLTVFLVLLKHLFSLQVLNGAYYRQVFQSQMECEETYHSSRGNIYGKNGNQLAYNNLPIL